MSPARSFRLRSQATPFKLKLRAKPSLPALTDDDISQMTRNALVADEVGAATLKQLIKLAHDHPSLVPHLSDVVKHWFSQDLTIFEAEDQNDPAEPALSMANLCFEFFAPMNPLPNYDDVAKLWPFAQAFLCRFIDYFGRSPFVNGAAFDIFHTLSHLFSDFAESEDERCTEIYDRMMCDEGPSCLLRLMLKIWIHTAAQESMSEAFVYISTYFAVCPLSEYELVARETWEMCPLRASECLNNLLSSQPSLFSDLSNHHSLFYNYLSFVIAASTAYPRFRRSLLSQRSLHWICSLLEEFYRSFDPCSPPPGYAMIIQACSNYIELVLHEGPRWVEEALKARIIPTLIRWALVIPEQTDNYCCGAARAILKTITVHLVHPSIYRLISKSSRTIDWLYRALPNLCEALHSELDCFLQELQSVSSYVSDLDYSQFRRCAFSECSEPHVTQRCSACRIAMYCSRTCQKKDWDSHRSVCHENKVKYRFGEPVSLTAEHWESSYFHFLIREQYHDKLWHTAFAQREQELFSERSDATLKKFKYVVDFTSAPREPDVVQMEEETDNCGKALFSRKVALPRRSFSIARTHRKPTETALLSSLNTLDKLLSSPEPETSEVRTFTEETLKDPRAFRSLRERSAVYEKLALILTRHRQVNEASWIVSRMEEEGFQPRPLTRARLIVAEILQSSPEERESLFSSLKDIIRQTPLKQDDLLALVDSFDWSVDKSHHIAARVVRDFIDCQKESYVPSAELATLLVNMQTRAGLLDDAYVTLRDLRPTAAAQEASRPFASTISNLAATNPAEDVFFGKVMGLMQDRAVGGDADTFNALIERERALGDHERVLAFYDLLRQLHSDGAVSPDGFTFINVFTSMALAKKPGKFTPRHLFRDLYSFYFYSADRSPPIDTDMMGLDQDILDRAILAFLNTKDPAAALVTLRMFALLGVPVSTNTYRRIVNYVAMKIKFSGIVWRRPFLREVNYTQLLDPDAVLQMTQPRGLDPKLVQHVLDSLRKRGGARYVVPSYGMMQGTAHIPNSARWDVIPLEDIMTMVIRTDLRVKLEKDSDFTEERLGQATRALVRETEMTMMPGGVTLRNWGNAPRSRGVGERKKDYGRRSRKQAGGS
ncbi:hypothetical protein BDZ89DRAFT_1154834 [Hymenopellis radicata]|nr:hypothetical protein BDZ89DRAFT_1154834 [Hymenopellis radicata]